MTLTHILRVEHRLNKLIIENRYPAPFKRLYGLLRSYTAIAIYRSRFLPVQASPAHIIATVLSKGDYYMDIGAAEGHLMTLASRAAGKLGRVYAFEPRENAFCHLKLLVAAYGLDNVILCQSLVGAYDGECQLFECLDHPTSSSISSKWAGGFSKTYPMITIVLLSNIIKEF